MADETRCFSSKLTTFTNSKPVEIMEATLDKNTVKEALRELIHEEPETFKEMLKEIMAEEVRSSDNEFEQLIQRNFQRFDATFRALA